MKRTLAIFALIALLVTVPLAFGSDLITNGSFEAGAKNAQWWQAVAPGGTEITGWTVGGPNGVSWASVNPSGFGDLNIAFTFQYGTLSQSFATTAGQEYTLSFYQQAPEDQYFPNMLQIDIAGNTYVTGSSPNWEHITTNFFATGSLTTLTFKGLDDATDWKWTSIDNVSVTEATGSNPVQTPEPANIALLASGLLTVAGGYWRRVRR